MNDVRAIVGKSSTGLVSHGVNDAEGCTGKSNAGEALCIVHGVACCHSVSGSFVLMIGINKAVLDQRHGTESRSICEIGSCCGYKSLNGMSHPIHSSVSNELLRHGLREFRINDRNIGCDLEIGDRVFDALVVIGDDGESGYFRCCT